MEKKLYSILGNSQKLDGGAMFGNAPKAMWHNWVEVDDQNRIDLACRALLIKEDNRNILLEAGIGAFFEPKMKERFGIVESHHVLLESLAEHGLTHEDIDVLVLSHLHFDHIGGILSEWQEGVEPKLLFPNAKILVGKEAWERAYQPHYRDRASFVPALLQPLKDRDEVYLVDSETHPVLGEDYRFHISNGHTPGMMLTEVSMPSGPVVFCADLIPGAPWVHLPITMGYDRFAEQLIDEKELLLSDLLERKGRLFFTHDAKVAMGRLDKNENGKYCLSETLEQVKNIEV
ncbi:MAG: MBL fold metallo-hydrolase [Gammaproteobacteria bacterium]|nr:MBL fold metallo-hydrolase [Gammaproteobacteria bacterium]MDH5629542.1 MBL fold metallo-hydrolase [Gammaproteobacteria bacterium]